MYDKDTREANLMGICFVIGFIALVLIIVGAIHKDHHMPCFEAIKTENVEVIRVVCGAEE